MERIYSSKDGGYMNGVISDWVLMGVVNGLNKEQVNDSGIRFGGLLYKYGWRVAISTMLLMTTACNKTDTETQVSPANTPYIPVPRVVFTPTSVQDTVTELTPTQTVENTVPSVIAEKTVPTEDVEETVSDPVPTEEVLVEENETGRLDIPFIKGISTMNQSKDTVCNQLNDDQIETLASVIKEAGATHMGVEVPWGDPRNCDADTLDYMRRFIEAAHDQGLNVWLRSTVIGFEDIYDAGKDTSHDHLEEAKGYLLLTLPLLKKGDVVTPFPEPHNTGVDKFNLCIDKCMFADIGSFNSWVRRLAQITKEALIETGMEDKVAFLCCGFDGFVTIGIHNEHHEGNTFLEDETLKVLNDTIVVDHYPPDPKFMERDLGFMAEGLSNIFGRDIDIIVGEWGTIPRDGFNGDEPSVEEPGNYQTETDMRYLGEGIIVGAREGYVKGAMYWQVGPAGRETLIYEVDGNLATTPHYDALRLIYESLP